MREIRYRGMQMHGTKAGRWLYGSLIVCESADKGYTHSIYDPCAPLQSSLSGFIYVDPKTVGQLTGRHDKNGTPIYGGDILTWHDPPVYWEVKWDEEWLGWHVVAHIKEYGEVDEGRLANKRNIEVIGNIHQNAELLEDKS